MNQIYTILKQSIESESLPKYIFFTCDETCNYFKRNEGTSNTKLSRYLAKLKDQRLLSFIKHSPVRYFDKVFNDEVSLDMSSSLDELKDLMNRGLKNYLFWLPDLNNRNNLFNEMVNLFLYKHISSSDSLTNSQAMNIVSDFAKAYNMNLSSTTFDDLIFNLNEWISENNKLRDELDEELYRDEQVNLILQDYAQSDASNLIFKKITFTGYTTVFAQFEESVKNVSFDRFSKEELVWLFDSFNINDKLSVVQYNQSATGGGVLKYIKFNSKNPRLIISLQPMIANNNKEQYVYCYMSKLLSNKKYSHTVITVILNVSLIEFKIQNIEETVSESVNDEDEDEATLEPSDQVISLDNNIINIMSQNTPLLINEVIETKLSAMFNIFNVKIDNVIFIDMLLNDDVMNTYLYIDERITHWSEKKRLIIHMRSREFNNDERSELIAMVSQIESTRLSKYRLEGSDEVIKLSPGDEYIEVNIIRSLTRDSVFRFYDIIRRVIMYYNNNRQGVEDEYTKIFPNMKFTDKKVMIEKVTEEKTRVKSRAKREELKVYAPDVFVTNYPRLCQKGRQPIVLEDEDEVQKHISQTFRYKDEVRHREVLRFPKDNPIYNFGCDNPRVPFIGVKKSELDNNNVYPYVPCCFEKPQMDPDTRSSYNDYYSDRVMGETSRRTKHRVITDKLLDFNSYGLVNKRLENLFEWYTSDKDVTLLRYGLGRSNNSLLHCILMAVKDPEYISLMSTKDDSRELYVRDMKLIIFNNLFYTLGLQEMYDYDENEVYDLALSDNKFLDPKLVFRYFEEYFDINIFVFKYKRNIYNNDVETKLEIPRHKLFHSRYVDKSKPTVLILKNTEKVGNKFNTNCELIISSKYTDINEAVTTFDSDITDYMLDMFTFVNKMKIIGFGPGELESYSDQFLYQDFNLVQSAGDKLQYVSQFIDDNGKCFGYVVYSEKHKSEIPIMFPPTRPFNLPLAHYNISFPKYHVVEDIFGQPSSRSIDSDGVWYSDTYFIPVADSVESIANIGPKQSYFIPNIKFIEKTHEKRIVLSVILNSIIKLVNITKINDAKQFFDEYVVMSRKHSEEYKLYISEFMNLALIDTLDVYLEKLADVISNLVINKKLTIYDHKLYYDLFYFTDLYIKNSEVKFKEWRPNIMDFYKYEENFSISNFTKVIIGEERLVNWINYEMNNKNRKVYNRLNTKLLNTLSVIMYHDVLNDVHYIIQRAKSLVQAINICYFWREYQLNNGLDTPDDEKIDTQTKYVVLASDLTGTLMISQKISSDDSYKLYVDLDTHYSLLRLP